MTLSAQLIAALAQVTRRLLVGLLLLAPSLGTAFAENSNYFQDSVEGQTTL